MCYGRLRPIRGPPQARSGFLSDWFAGTWCVAYYILNKYPYKDPFNMLKIGDIGKTQVSKEQTHMFCLLSSKNIGFFIITMNKLVFCSVGVYI